MDNYKQLIAENITILRQSNKLTQAELAERLNYSDKAVSKWERGESIPDILTLKQLSDMFGVTVDFLLKSHKQEDFANKKDYITNNRIVITLMSVVLVWFVSTIIFVSGQTWLPQVDGFWLTYVFAVPISLIVVLVFNSIWGKKRFNYLIISCLGWSVLCSIYITFFEQNYWMLFFIGIPGQVIVILWSRLKKRK